MRYYYINLIGEMLIAISRRNSEAICDFANEFFNLVSDKVEITEDEMEIAEELDEWLNDIIDEYGYEEE